MAAPKPSTEGAQGAHLAELLTLPPEHGGLLTDSGDLYRLVCRLRWRSEEFEGAVAIAQAANRQRTAPRLRRRPGPLAPGSDASQKPGAEWSVKPMRPDKVRKLVARVWRQFPAGRKPDDAPVIPRRDADRNRHVLAALAEYATTEAEWRGPGAASARRLLLALLAVAHGCARITFTASHRQLMEGAGIGSFSTLAGALRRLYARGLVEVAKPADRAPATPFQRPTATTYRLRLPAAVVRRLQAEADGAGQTCSNKALTEGLRGEALLLQVCPPDAPASPAGNAWRPKHRHGGGFGESARLVWHALTFRPDGATVGELAESIRGAHRRTVARACARLAGAELVSRDAAGRWRLTGRDPDDALAALPCSRGCTPGRVVDDCPTHDKGRSQKRQHERDRLAYDDARAEKHRQSLRAADRRRERAERREEADRRAKCAAAIRANPAAERKAALLAPGVLAKLAEIDAASKAEAAARIAEAAARAATAPPNLSGCSA